MLIMFFSFSVPRKELNQPMHQCVEHFLQNITAYQKQPRAKIIKSKIEYNFCVKILL